mmetsp:Transcript_7910/g.32588  ORF Transcript_7910/g.32588 Transcript_7910/m.32588 type:complete len:353 (-) Transcript_7910:1209-2267(-)
MEPRRNRARDVRRGRSAEDVGQERHATRGARAAPTRHPRHLVVALVRRRRRGMRQRPVREIRGPRRAQDDTMEGARRRGARGGLVPAGRRHRVRRRGLQVPRLGRVWQSAVRVARGGPPDDVVRVGAGRGRVRRRIVRARVPVRQDGVAFAGRRRVRGFGRVRRRLWLGVVPRRDDAGGVRRRRRRVCRTNRRRREGVGRRRGCRERGGPARRDRPVRVAGERVHDRAEGQGVEAVARARTPGVRHDEPGLRVRGGRDRPVVRPTRVRAGRAGRRHPGAAMPHVLFAVHGRRGRRRREGVRVRGAIDLRAQDAGLCSARIALRRKRGVGARRVRRRGQERRARRPIPRHERG